MGKLVFRVASDWQEVVRLRTEIEKLKQTLLSMDSTQSPDAFQKLNAQLGESSKKLDGLVTEAAKAGAVMEGDFKKKIFDASQTVNGFTEKIISQKNAIKGFEQDLRALQEEYRKITKNGGKSQDGLDRIHRMKNIIAEEKDALFNLTQQQANARLSVKKLRDEYALYKNDGKQIVDTNQNIGISLKKALGVIGGIAALKQLGSEIIRVRGEFQSMQTAIETMVGKDVAGKIMPQIKELAKISPLTMSDMVGAEKMMLGFNIQAEDTIKYLKALSDISMGESSKFNSLTLAFSQMSATGKLMGQDLNQMINAGFNPLQVIAEKTGKSIATLKDEMSKGAVSAEMVQQAFIDATSAGGKFYGMSENASQTINGQISMMQDAWDNALNEMGQSSEGFIMSGIQATTSLIQNYETVGKVLVGLIATYGVYRTALITNIALTRGWAVAARADAVAKGLQTMATKAQTVAQLALNSAMKANPYVLAATLIMGAATAMWALHDSTTAAEKAQKRFNDEQERFNKQQEDRKQKVEQLIRIIQDETETEYAKVKAYEELRTLSPALTEAYTREKLATLELTKRQKALNEERDKTNYDEIISHINKYEEYVKRLSKNGDKLVNVGDLYTGIVGEYGANTSWKDRLELAENDLKKWKDALFEYNRLKKEVEENNKPIEVRLNAAKENEKNIKEALETIDDLILTKKREVEGHEIKIPLSSEGAAQEAESLENKVKNLKAKVEGDDIKIPFKPNEYLNKIPSLFEQERDNWVNMGMFTIPVSIELERNKITGLLSAAQKAVSALSGNSVRTYKDAYELAKKEWMAAKKALEESKKKSKDDYDKAKKELAVKEKAYKDLGGVTDKELKKQESEAEKQKKEREAALKAETQRQEELLSLRRQNQQNEINLMEEGADKKLKQIELDYQKELDVIKKQEKAWSEVQGGKLTAEQSVQISLSYSQAEGKRDKSISEMNKEEFEAMNRYLKEYGTFQQRKDAITKEYSDKMAQATTEGDKKVLQKEMEESLSSLNMDKLKQEINWELIFGDLDKASKKSLEQVKQQLKEFKSSDEYKNMSVDQKKVIDEALNNIQSTIIDKGGLLGNLPEQLDALRIAQEELNKAQEEYNDAIKNGTDAEKEAALKKKNNAEKNVQNAQVNVTKSADKTSQNLITLADTITELGSSSEISLSQIGSLANGLIDTFTEAGSKIGGIVGAAFSLLDAINKQGLDGFIENIFSSVFKASASIWDTITFGAFSKITGSGDSDKNLERDIEYLTQSNQDLKNSLDNLSDKMDKASVTDANDIYEVQKENLKKQESNSREAMQRSGAAYSNGFLGIGGSHSSNDKINKGMSTSEWKRVSDVVGKSVYDAGQFFQLSSEQMAKLAEEDTTLYSKIKDLANDGYKDAAQYMDEYITYYKQLEELENAHNEKLTNTSFDSIRNDFKNALLDMESDADDFTKNFEKMMQNAIVESLMTKKYDALIQAWYEDFAKAMEGDGKIDKDEQRDLKRDWDDIVNKGIAERDALKDLMGWDASSSSSQSSTQKGFQAMSQDTGNELNGRFTALQIAGEEIKNQSIIQTGLLSSINEKMSLLDLSNEDIPQLAASSPNIAGQTRKIITNSYQPQVNVVFPDAKLDVLTAEVYNLRNTVEGIQQMQAERLLDGKDVLENTRILAKNSPKILSDAGDIKRSLQR